MLLKQLRFIKTAELEKDDHHKVVSLLYLTLNRIVRSIISFRIALRSRVFYELHRNVL